MHSGISSLHTKDLCGWDIIGEEFAVSSITFLCGQGGISTVLVLVEMQKNLLASRGCVQLGMAVGQMWSWRFNLGEIK